MPKHAPDTQHSEDHRRHRTVLELTVNNHPGVMSHVCGLFSRRGYNVEGILCMPVVRWKQNSTDRAALHTRSCGKETSTRVF